MEEAVSRFSARRPNANDLPSFELPPPPTHKFPAYVPTSALSGQSIGRLLTPPPNGASSTADLPREGTVSHGAGGPLYQPTGFWPVAPNESNTSSASMSTLPRVVEVPKPAEHSYITPPQDGQLSPANVRLLDFHA
jgi:hypothetical protein